jgi:hypothetical protein
MIKKLLSKLSSLFKDGKTPDWSSIRFSFLLTSVVSTLAFWIVWIVLCSINNKMIEIPESVIVLYCVSHGISSVGKLVQKNQEVGKEEMTKE